MCPPVSALQSVQVTAERKGGRTNCWSVSCQVETVYADHRSSIHVVPMQKCCFPVLLSFFFSLILEEKIAVSFEKHRCCHEVVLDSSLCICQEVSSAVSRTFTTAYGEERSAEVLSAFPGVCSSGLNEPVSPGNSTNYT